MLLVNELTQSKGEFTAMAFQAGNNSCTVGSKTAGTDGNVSSIMMPGGVSTRITGTAIFYPDGRDAQRIGLKIDHEGTPNVKGIRDGKDELLEKTIEIITNY